MVEKKQQKESTFQSDERQDSEIIRSTTVGVLMACPHDDLALLMAWMEECIGGL